MAEGGRGNARRRADGERQRPDHGVSRGAVGVLGRVGEADVLERQAALQVGGLLAAGRAGGVPDVEHEKVAAAVEAAATVCLDGATDAAFDLLASLVDKSLLYQAEQSDGEPRFGMLETIREFALEALDETGERRTLEVAHAEWCRTLAVASVTQGTNGAVVINADQTVSYTPAASYNGGDSFTYTVSDNSAVAPADRLITRVTRATAPKAAARARSSRTGSPAGLCAAGP